MTIFTVSPVVILMKCFRNLPEIWASTLWPLANSTRNIVPGSTDTIFPSTSTSSSGIIKKLHSVVAENLLLVKDSVSRTQFFVISPALDSDRHGSTSVQSTPPTVNSFQRNIAHFLRSPQQPTKPNILQPISRFRGLSLRKKVSIPIGPQRRVLHEPRLQSGN